MTAAYCPICHSPYTEEIDRICPTCSWNLTYYNNQSQNRGESLRDRIKSLLPGEGERILESAQLWAQSKWQELLTCQKKLADAESKYQGLLERLEEDRLTSLRSSIEQLETDYLSQKEARQGFEEEHRKQQTELFNQVQQLQKDLTETKAKIRRLEQTTLSNTQGNSLPEAESLRNVGLNAEESYVIANYPHNLETGFPLVTKVSVSKVTIENIFSGVPTTIIFEPSRRGDYYVITLEQADYLIPIQDLQVNQHNLRTVQYVFELLEYGANQSRDFRLVKPAQVYPKNETNTWELVKTGILQFDLRGNGYDFS